MKKPLKPRVQGLNIQSSVLRAPLNQVDREPSSFRHPSIVPKLVLLATQSGTKAHNTVQPDTLKVDWFNGARISIKPVKVARQIGPYRALPAGPIRDKPIRKGDRSTYLTDKGKGGSYG